MGLICRWKAPWVQRIAPFFAEGRKKRPYRVALDRDPGGELVKVFACRAPRLCMKTPIIHSRELTTGGVRADRVGAKPPP